MKIEIGADEIILWLRKNGKANKIPNDGFNGQKIQDNSPSYWPVVLGDNHIGEYELPQTSAQYTIDINNLPKLFSDLSKW